MKSQTVRKLGLCVTGAMLLGATAAAALSVDEQGLGSIPIFTNSAPNVKIVIGSQSQPSDAVAAANIAAMIGNMAYTSSDLTVLGKDALSCEGGSSQGGSNATVSGISATVEVSAPSGVNSNVAYQMKTYVGGYLDKDATDDRADSWGSVGQLVPSAYNSDYAGRRITSYESPLAYKGSVTDNTGSKSYTEEEKFYFYAQPKYDASSKTVKSQQPKIGYEAVFTDPIPVCTNQNPSNTTCDQQYKSDTHRIKIKLLGAEWVIYGMYNFNPSGISGSSTQVVLGKEVQYKEFMQIGEEAVAPNGYKAKLKDISSQPYGGIHESAVAFEIYDANGNMVDIATLQPGGVNEYSKYGLTVKLWQAFVGTTGAAYAKVSVVSDKLTLTNNGEIDSDNRPWMVSIQEGGSTFGASLSKIQLTNVAESTNGLSAGESLYFVKKPKLMAFTFNGIETVSSSDSLRMNFISPQYLPMNSTDSTTRANVVVLQSNRANAFQFGGDSSDRAYYVIGANNSIPMGSILYNKNGFFQLYTGNVNGTLNFVDYNYGPNTIKIAFNSASIEPNAYPDMADYVIHVPEYTTDSDGAPYAYKIDVGNAETSNPSFTQSGSNYLGYGAVSSYPYPDNVANNYESGFMSMRGGTATVSQSSANINYLGSVAHALYTFSAANTSVGNGTAYSSKFGKGDTILDSNGYLVRLTDLNCNIAGGVGGSALPGELTGADGLKCSQTSAFTVNQLNTANTPLVVLDSQANAGDTLILVGGPLVNSLTASVVSEIQPNEAMVKVVGNKIVVAGYSAADTTAAANSLINWLSNHRNE